MSEPSSPEGIPVPEPSAREPEEVVSANAAADYIENAVDESRKKFEGEDVPHFDNKEEYELTVAYKIFNPGKELSDDQKGDLLSEHVAAKNIVGERHSLDPDQVITVANHLTKIGIRKDHEKADAVLEALYPTLTPEARDEIKEQLKEMEQGERPENEDISDEEADEMAAKTNALMDRAKEDVERIHGEIDVRTDIGPEEKKELKVKASGLLTKITDFFAEEMPGREWSKKIGKKLYWSLIIAFIFIIWEMNMISKVAKK